MKKSIILIVTLLTLFFIPTIVNAEGHCRVVSGNGSNLGSEVDCGGEHFYIFDKDNSNLRLLAKYNLLDGNEYERIVVSGYNPTFEDNEKAQSLINQGFTYSCGYDIYSDISTCIFTNSFPEKNKTIRFDAGLRTYREILFLPEVYDAIQNEGYIPIYTSIESTLFYDSTQSQKINGEYYYYASGIKLYKNDNYIYEIHMADDSQCLLNLNEIQNTEEYQQKMAEGYSFQTSRMRVIKSGSYYYCGYYYEKNNESRVIKQSELAMGAHGEVRGIAEYPEYGSFTANPLGLAQTDTSSIYTNNNYRDVLLTIDFKYPMTISLLLYRNYLESLNLNLSDINLITVNDLNNFTYKTANTYLPLDDWSSNWQQGNHFGTNFNIIGSLKDHIPDDYSWIWATTYWTRTRDSGSNVYFVDTWGDMCNGYYCSADVGAGLRPIITVSKNEILYNIVKETDNNGEIEVVDNSAGNETISFKVSPKKGYKLSKITITTENGDAIEFTEGDLIKNPDGTVSILNNQFTMPFENVTIKVDWKEEVIETIQEENPQTIDSISKYMLILFASFGTLTIINIKKKELM